MIATILLTVVSAPTHGIEWQKLNTLNDPPGRPTVKAAKAATNGMSRQEMTQNLARLRLAEVKGRSTANGTALHMLRREIQLIEVALENR